MSDLPTELPLPDGFRPMASVDGATAARGIPVPRDAATVMLLREGGDGMEVFLLRRVAGMAFAGGMTVFPGGGVDQRDMETSVAWSGPDPDWWGRRFGCAPVLARALVCAAVRETFEEAGVLLAGAHGDSIVEDTGGYRDARTALVNRSVSLARFLADAELVLRTDLLRPWANWVTPAEEPRRFDARFFLAVLPEGQSADGMTTEADLAGWRRPADVLEDWKVGRCSLLPPTWMTLTELAEAGSVEAAMAQNRAIKKIIPRVIRRGDVLHAVFPGHPDYDSAVPHLPARPDDRLERS